MHASYFDIMSRIPEPPKWYTQDGVPRYVPFEPSECSDIYAREAVLLLIACQACGHKFLVERVRGHFDRGLLNALHRWREGGDHQWFPLHYGDPPFHGCIGDTMNCEDLNVLEVWRRPDEGFEWERIPSLEGEIPQS